MTTSPNLSALMKEVGDALRLDNEGDEKEAYKKYVGCIYNIAANLLFALKSEGGEVIVNAMTVKQVKLAQQCTERVAEIILALDASRISAPKTELQTSYTPSPVSSPKLLQKSSQPKRTESPVHEQSKTPIVRQSSMQDASIRPPDVFSEDTRAHRFSAPVPALPPENNPHTIVALKKSLTPMEKASKQNQSLMAAYKARMLRLNKSDLGAFNYSLTIQRKMAENIAIAKAQEEELARKMQARNQRLEQEAAKRFSCPNDMSEEEKEHKAIYKNILEYENEAMWLQSWRAKLSQRPEDPVLICQLVQEVLRCSDHPITELLRQYQFKVYQKLFPLIENKAQHLSQIQVPYPEHLWPPLEDVNDIVHNNANSSKPSLATQGKSEETTALSDFVSNDHNMIQENGSGDAVGDKESTHSGEETDLSVSENKSHASRASESADNSLDAAKLEPTLKQDNKPKVSWERKQAKLLMKQVSQRTNLDLAEEDNLDYLYDEADNGESDDMYSSLGFTSLSSGSVKQSPSPLEHQESATDTQVGGPGMGRSVSHYSQDRRSLQDQDEVSQYQSLPYFNPSLRAADEEEKKKLAKLGLEACERHLKSICDDIHRYLEKLLTAMTVAYEPLDTPIGRDQCAVALEEPFFKPIWKKLLQLFRVVNYREEQVLACVMTKLFASTPADFKVNKKLWLIEEPESEAQVSSSSPATPGKQVPYERAITALKQVGDHYTMLNKLECVVKVCRLICECIDDYYAVHKSGKKAPSVGADDLLPILCFVVVQSAMPQLASECQAMSEFIQEGYLMGEEGYCLTTLRTALDFVTSLYPNS